MYEDLVLAIVGSGGEGVVSAGEILVRATSHEGLFSMMVKSYGPQIRGGECMAQVRLGKQPVRSQGDFLDALMVLSWENYPRFAGEIFLDGDSVIFHDEADAPPANLSFPKSVRLVPFPLAATAKQTAGTDLAKNIVALGFLCGWFGLPQAGFHSAVKQRFAKKSESVLQSNLKAFDAGISLAETHAGPEQKDWRVSKRERLLMLSGNEAIALGSLFAGANFFAGYPITPASEIMEWMAVELPKFKGVFIQTEEEIAAVTMAIGASFAGAKAMTATSGPGLSLMTEAVGLATMAELPLVIVDVQRGGPCTGIPTKTSQSDLLHAVFGGHGNLPRIVLAPTDAADAAYIAVHAFYLAEKYQMPVSVLSDQFLGQRLEVIPQIDFESMRSEVIGRTLAAENELGNFVRFRPTANGISNTTIPGMKGGMYMAAGIEHNEQGRPTADTQMHEKMTLRRQKKILTLRKQEADLLWRCGDQEAEIGVLAWGSSRGVVEEAVMQLREQGLKIAAVVPRQLSPLPTAKLQAFINQLDALLIVELADGQFYTYLKSELNLPERTRVYKRAGATPFTVHEITSAIKEVENKWKPTPQRVTAVI